MLARNEIMIKWSLYAAAAALCLLAQGAIFHPCRQRKPM